MAYDTLEEAQARILELEEENQRITGERDTLSQNNESLTQQNENLRTLNQKYFNKLIAQEEQENPEEKDEPEVPTCEEFAVQLLTGKKEEHK